MSPHRPPRRDPRAERKRRDRKQGADTELSEKHSSRSRRRDPRQERRTRSRRSDRHSTKARETPQPIVIEEPTEWVLAVPELVDGHPDEHDRDILGGGRALADPIGAAVAVLDRKGEAEADLGMAGADRFIRPEPNWQAQGPEDEAALIQAAIERLEPHHILFPDLIPGCGDLGRRVAAMLGEEAAVDVRWLDARQAVSRGDGQRSEYYRSPPPRLLLLAPEAAAPHEGAPHEARPLEPLGPFNGTRQTGVIEEGPIPIDPQTIPLSEAAFILAGGNGVKDWESFHRLSRALGATEGGSREACDAGYLPSDRQVGISGTLVEADCYLALGISGAPQHLQGITNCDQVIAVNTDPYAPIMKRADLAIVADVQAVMKALLRLVEGQDHGT